MFESQLSNSSYQQAQKDKCHDHINRCRKSICKTQHLLVVKKKKKKNCPSKLEIDNFPNLIENIYQKVYS